MTRKVQKNWLEWTVFAAGLVLITATLGYLVYYGMKMGEKRPAIEIRLGTPQREAHHFTVPVVVINHGDHTAEGVKVEVVLGGDGQEEERGEFSLPFLARRARREGWVTFTRDPSGGTLKARVLGYEKP